MTNCLTHCWFCGHAVSDLSMPCLSWSSWKRPVSPHCWILWTLLSVPDLSMAALFELVESETSHNVPYNSTTSLPFKETLLRLFETHILPTHNICHLQYLIFFVAGSLQGFARLLIHFLSKIAYFKKCFFKARIGRRARSSFCGIGPFLKITPRPAFSDSPPSPISQGRKIIPHL